MHASKRALLIAACGLAAGALPLAASAQGAAWPTKPVRLIVGFPGGSTPDIAARTIAESLAKALGQPVVVDNKPGASGNIAADQVAKATDDHTIGVVINGNLTSSKMLYPKLPYDPAQGLHVPVADRDGAAGAGDAKQPARRARPSSTPRATAGDKWSYGSVGVGSVGHLGMELLKCKVPGSSAVHVPYQGNPQVMTDLIGKQIQMALMPPGVALPQIKAGKVKAIGLTSGRSTLAPDVLAAVGCRCERLPARSVDGTGRPREPLEGRAGPHLEGTRRSS